MTVVTSGVRSFRTHALTTLAGVLLALAAGACNKVPLLAPSSSTISVSAGTSTLPLGGSTEITAFVAEGSGTPVQNGTTVTFRTTMGSLSETTVQTRNGFATTTFMAGNASGIAEIRATSGGIGTSGATTTTSGSTTTTTTASNVVQVTIGSAAAKTVLVSATPTVVPSSGGTVTVSAAALDANGNRLVGVPVSFTTTAGTLSTSTATSDANGDARVTLTTNRAATVTATVAGQSGKVDITVAPLQSVTLAVAPNPGSVGQAVTLTVTPPTAVAGSSAPTPRVVITWGDGTASDLGVVSGAQTVTHIYNSAGIFTITATATGEGDTFTTSTTVTINARAPVAVNVTSSSATPARNTPVTFTAAATSDTGTTFSSFVWRFLDSNGNEEGTTTTTGNQVTHVFTTPGIKTVEARVAASDGRTGSGQTQIVVQ
jgi:adhesin/invasin